MEELTLEHIKQIKEYLSGGKICEGKDFLMMYDGVWWKYDVDCDGNYYNYRKMSDWGE